jgi:predicted ATPase
LNGALTSLGQFDDLKSSGSESDQIAIKFTCRPLYDPDRATSPRSVATRRGSIYYGLRSNNLSEVTCEISFDADPSSSDRDLFQIQPRLFASQLNCTSRDEDNVDQKAEILVRYSNKLLSETDSIDDIGEIDDQLRAGLSYDVHLDDTSMAEVKEDFRSARAIGCILRHFLPDRVIYDIETLQEDANAVTIALQDDFRHSFALRRHLGRDILLSKEIISVLRDVLEGVVKFDDIFMGNREQQSLFELDSESMPLRAWLESVHLLPRDTRINVQQALRETDDLFDRILDAMKISNPSSSEHHDFIPYRPPRQIAEAAWYLDEYFSSSLKYLGPLRDAPKPLYPLAPAADPHDVGLRGEHTASILELHKNKKIKYIPSIHFKVPTVDRKAVTRTLETAVIDWLQYLGVASSVKSRDQGKLGYELKVGLSDSDVTYDLTHVGVGVSQVLPILVMCLLADTDSTLVFEQPELHLHPKVQTLLGDFFLSMALCNKQCIVETHSEYFIDRLRFRIAAASSENELNSLTKIYFVEKPSQGSFFREVVINEYGAISDWPEGFFDQSQQQAEEILRAAAMKRKASRKKTDG